MSAKRRQIVLELDALDYDAVQAAMCKRQAFGRTVPGLEKTGLMPDGDSNRAGALIAEICRGWMEVLRL